MFTTILHHITNAASSKLKLYKNKGRHYFIMHLRTDYSLRNLRTILGSNSRVSKCMISACLLLHLPPLLSAPDFSTPAVSTLEFLTVSHIPLPHFQSPLQIHMHFTTAINSKVSTQLTALSSSSMSAYTMPDKILLLFIQKECYITLMQGETVV